MEISASRQILSDCVSDYKKNIEVQTICRMRGIKKAELYRQLRPLFDSGELKPRRNYVSRNRQKGSVSEIMSSQHSCAATVENTYLRRENELLKKKLAIYRGLLALEEGN